MPHNIIEGGDVAVRRWRAWRVHRRQCESDEGSLMCGANRLTWHRLICAKHFACNAGNVSNFDFHQRKFSSNHVILVVKCTFSPVAESRNFGAHTPCQPQSGATDRSKRNETFLPLSDSFRFELNRTQYAAAIVSSRRGGDSSRPQDT